MLSGSTASPARAGWHIYWNRISDTAIPPQMREEIGYMVKDISDREHKELSPVEVYRAFAKEYVNVFDPIDITDATFDEGFGLQIQ